MTLIRTWAALVGLAALTAALAAFGPARPLFVIGLLALSGAKARLILDHYLDLRVAPVWSKGFFLALSALLITFGLLGLAA